MAGEQRTTRIATITLVDDWLLREFYEQGSQVTLADAQEEIRLLQELAAGRKLPILVDLRPLKSVDGDARSYFSGEEAAATLSAAAFLVASPVSRVLGNFFIGLNKPSFPVKLFSSEAEAIEWLRGVGQ